MESVLSMYPLDTRWICPRRCNGFWPAALDIGCLNPHGWPIKQQQEGYTSVNLRRHQRNTSHSPSNNKERTITTQCKNLRIVPSSYISISLSWWCTFDLAHKE